jgi:uncharacterized protein YqjF (DUF2071 family)
MEDGAPEAITPLSPHDIRRPVMLQGWHDLSALHWRYEPEEVQALLPNGFAVDTFDGAAWVGLIPFHMREIRHPRVGPFGPLSTFPETNVRTYVVDPAGRRGVWFFSLDVTRFIPALVARVTYNLPYCWARMSITTEPTSEGTTWRYTSSRRWPRGEASSLVAVRVGRSLAEAETTDLDHFLTARWALGTTLLGSLMWAKVDHPQWPLHEAEALEWDETMFAAAGLRPPTDAPFVRWSPGVTVRIERPRRIRLGER